MQTTATPAPQVAGGALSLRVAGPCSRCAMVEIDPSSGAKHGAVLRALARHHRERARLLFGVFCAPAAAGAAGATVELREGADLVLDDPMRM